ATGGLLYKLVRQMTNSERKSQIALLSWYCNPFNIYWIEAFGAMDAIPTFILVLAIVLGMKRRWFSCGICAAIAGILRIFPLLVFPFLFAQSKAKSWREYALLLSGFLLPLVCAITAMYKSGAGTLSMIASLPQGEYWLLDFLGVNLNQYVKLTPVLLVVQFFITIYYWRRSTLVQGATVALLTLFVGALPYGGYGYHFLWVSPLLSACVSLNFDELWVFIFHFCNCVIISANDFYSVTFAQCLRTTVRRGFLCSEGDLSSKDQCRKHQTYSEWQITGTYSVLERATWFEGVNIEKIPKERKSDYRILFPPR